ncbi:MAG: hypothetical protein L0H19_01955, partial [Salinisphaera sp.]|nr:hypothetical protein [Salinisphaera sp.]
MTSSAQAASSADTTQAEVRQDSDPQETREWLDALAAVIEIEGPERAHFLLETLIEKSRRSGAHIPFSPYTAYVNTIHVADEARSPGDPAGEDAALLLQLG